MAHRDHWTEEEDKIIENNFNLKPKEIVKLLDGRTDTSIRSRKRFLKENNFEVDYSSVGHRPYSKEEDVIIKKYKNLSAKKIAEKLKNRTYVSVKNRRRELGLKIKNHLPDFLKDWYESKLNNNIEFNDYTYVNRKDVLLKIRCKKIDEHIFDVSLNNLVLNYDRSKNVTCPFCEGREVFYKESLEYLFPTLSKNFSKKNKLKASQVKFDNHHNKFIFTCDKKHSLEYRLATLTLKNIKKKIKREDYEYPCDICLGIRVYYNKQLMEHISLEKNDIDELKELKTSNNVQVWFKCKDYKDHFYPRSITEFHKNLSKGKENKCLICTNRLLKEDFNSIYARLKNNNLQFDIEKNKADPKKIIFTGKAIYWWYCKKCKASFEENSRNIFRHGKREPECYYCSGKKASKEYSLKSNYPHLYKEIKPELNPNIDIDDLLPNSHQIITWTCSIDDSHVWPISVLSRTKSEKCPFCQKRWNENYLKLFLKSTIPFLPNMDQGERWVFFQHSGILSSTERNIAFAKQVASEKFPIEEIEKFVNEEPSLVNDILDDPTITSEDYLQKNNDKTISDDFYNKIESVENHIYESDEYLPTLKSDQILKTLDEITSSQFCDKEAIEFLVISKKEKIWRDVFERKEDAVREIKKVEGNEYVQRVKDEFLSEYESTSLLTVPDNFTAKDNDGNQIIPNLMQFLTTTRLKTNSRIGNWSGTGAGKTLSAILASRLLNLKLTIVTCPNSVVKNWEKNIRNTFADSIVIDKQNLPEKIDNNKNNYIVINYEQFQQPSSANYVKKLLSYGMISFIVIDEVHYSKQRELDNVSKRKEMIKNLVVEAGKKNNNLKVLGMSATPVINTLFEGRSMIELITGKEHKDIETKININNCMYLFQKLTTIGTRYLPNYEVGIKETILPIDCSQVIDEIREKGSNRISVLDLEIILTKVRIKEIVNHLEKKTIIYTHYIKGIDKILADAVIAAGFTVGFYTGEDKSGLDNFVNKNIDILIGTSAIGTGVDELQNVSRKLIFNVLPWTNAEYEQIKGRIYRQGQKRDVEFIIPQTYATINGEEWSWCKTKLGRIKYKKTIADAAVDGKIPEEHLRSEHQVLQDLLKWLDRLEGQETAPIEREELVSSLFTEEVTELRKRKRNHGDFSKINKRWNNSRSVVTNKRLQKNKTEWVHYHEEYRKAREDWAITPFKEMIKFYEKRDGLTIGDFGCGEAFFAKELSYKHKVYSLDHVGIEDFVIECDFAKTPLNDDELDVAIFSLSLMGSNISEYLIEAHRVLRLDGKLNIIEPTNRFKNLENFKNRLTDFGFDNIVSKDMWKFTHIIAEKTGEIKNPNPSIKL